MIVSTQKKDAPMSRAPSLVRAIPAKPAANGLLSTVIDTVVAWSLRSRERAMLARLDDHLLRDMGLDADSVAEECRKPGWRA